MSQQAPVWLEVLSRTLRRLSGNLSVTAGDTEQNERPNFKWICSEVEASLAKAGVRPEHVEWQATKRIMRSIYDKTKSAEKNGYTYYQYALTPHLADMSLRNYLQSPQVQQAVELWCSALGWQRASLVNWTSVEAAIALESSSRYPFVANEFAVRLEGLSRQTEVSARREQPAPRDFFTLWPKPGR